MRGGLSRAESAPLKPDVALASYGVQAAGSAPGRHLGKPMRPSTSAVRFSPFAPPPPAIR